MLDKDSVQARLAKGLSFTEFSYMLLQAADFAHLRRSHGVELQCGGADQWGNITAGLELIRRTARPRRGARERAHGLAYPLLLSPSGAKFGKSESGDSIWLDPTLTSPYRYYQYWVDADDRDVGLYLRWFTMLDRSRIDELEAEHAAAPERRGAQRVLAREVTTMTHGRGGRRPGRPGVRDPLRRRPDSTPTPRPSPTLPPRSRRPPGPRAARRSTS